MGETRELESIVVAKDCDLHDFAKKFNQKYFLKIPNAKGYLVVYVCTKKSGWTEKEAFLEKYRKLKQKEVKEFGLIKRKDYWIETETKGE